MQKHVQFETPVGIPELVSTSAIYNIVSDPIMPPTPTAFFAAAPGDPPVQEVRLTSDGVPHEWARGNSGTYLNVKSVNASGQDPTHQWKILLDPSGDINGSIKICTATPNPTTGEHMVIDLFNADVKRDNHFLVWPNGGWGSDLWPDGRWRGNGQRFWILPLKRPGDGNGEGSFYIINERSNLHLTLHNTWSTTSVDPKVRQFNQFTKHSVWKFKKVVSS